MIRALLLLSALAVGCREPAPATPGRRIVSLAPNVTEMLFRVGAGPEVVGVTRYCERPPEAKALPKIGGFADPNLEAILALRPDLVVAPENPVSGPVVARLSALGISTLVVRADDLGGIDAALQAIGTAVGRGEAGALAAAELRAGLEAAAQPVPAGAGPRVLFVYGHRPLVAAGPGTFADELIRRAGARNAAAEARVAYPKYALEDVLRLAPEVILDASMGEEGGQDARAFWGRWPEVPAVASGRVFRAEHPGLVQPGVRVAEGLSWLVDTLHGAPR